MTALLRHRAGRPLPWGRSARPARHLRRAVAPLTAPAALALGVVAGALVAPSAGSPATGVLAAWTSSTQVSAAVSMARVGSSFSALNTAGTVSSDGLSYRIAGLLTTNTGYVDLVNTSTTPATLSLTVSTGTLVGVTPATVCSQPWNTASGACPGSASVIGLSMVAGSNTGSYSTAAPLPPGGRVHLKVSISGVVNAVTLTARPPAPRPPMDRTHP